jgi:hypothetical protein
LDHATEVDRGELSVSDMWVVLIKPARVSAEKAASLQAQAQTEQKEINRLLVAVGDADNGTAEKVQAAAKDFGFAVPARTILEVWTRPRGCPNLLTKSPIRCRWMGSFNRALFATMTWRRRSAKAVSGPPKTVRSEGLSS